MEIQPTNVKYVCEKIINTNLNKGLELIETIKNLEKYFKRNLSQLDKLYVEDIYVELLLTKWLQHDPDQTVRSIRSDQIVEFAKKLETVKSYSDCSTCSIKSKFSSLILKLYKESPRLQELEEMYVLRYVQECCILIQSHFSIKGEFDSFINKFVTLLKNTCDLEELGTLLKFEDFISETLTCQDFVQNLLDLETSDTNILQIQQEREIVVNNRYDCLQSNLTEIINKFLEPVVVKQMTVDGRSVLEMTGHHIVWSRDLLKWETENNFSHVQEVRVVNASVIHADVDLINSFWHGKNLVIFSETLIFKNGTSRWDVSGAHGDKTPSPDADNVPGESGGNVLLKVDSVEGGKLLIISNGGNGSRGLDGSPGINGEDGDFIDGVSFKKMFPPPAKFQNSYKIESIKKIKESLSEKLDQIESFYSNGIEIRNVDLKSLSQWFSESYTEQLTDFFIKGKTHTGCEITFSFYYGYIYDKCQSYLLYKGAPGKQGTTGEMEGLGGNPGFAGDINLFIGCNSDKVSCLRMNGNHGIHGQPGTCGQPGMSGADCGFMDKSLTTEWPKVFVTNPDDDKMLTIDYSDDSSSNNVYCPYRKKYVEIKDTEKRLSVYSQHVSALSFRRRNNNIQQATRKKTIDLKSMMNQYKTNTSSFANLNYSVETLVNIVNELMSSKDLETDHVVKETKITRQLTYKCNTDYRCKTIPEDSIEVQSEVVLKNDIICNYQGLKYKLKVLNNIDVEFFREASLKLDSNKLEFHNCFNGYYDKIFFVNENQEDFFSEYFGFNSSKSREKVKTLFYESYISELTGTILLFIKANGFSKYISNELLQNISGERLIPLIMLLEHKEFGKLNKQLCKCILEKNNDLFVQVSLKMSENEFLNKLYKLYQSETRKLEGWINNIDYVVERELRKNISEKILEHGPFGDVYREFLSHYYSRNIHFYSLDKKGHIELISNHNPRGKTEIHILLKEGKFYQLSVDFDFAKMLQSQKVKGRLYSKILFHIDTLTDKTDFDKFAARSPYMLNIYKGVDKSIATYVKYIQIMNQDRDIQKIKSYFSSDDNILISLRLEKLKVKYIGYSNILHYMALHFENEGSSITTREFCFILNFIIGNALTMPDSLPLTSWIIASSSPSYWLIELTLLKLEIYLRRNLTNETKERWRNYMSNLGEKARLMAFFEKICEDTSCYVDVDCIDVVLYLMSCVPRAHIGLEHIDLGHWKYYLKDKYWLHQLKANTLWPEEIVQQASLYFAVLDNYKGFEQTEKVLQVVIKHAEMVENDFDSHLIVDVLRDLTNKEICLDNGFIEILLTATIQNWRNKLEEACFDSNNERSLKQIVELVKTCGNTSENIKKNLSVIENLVGIVNNEIYAELSEENKLKEWIRCILQVSHEKRISTVKFIDTVKLIVGQIFRNDDENKKIEKVMRNYEEVVLATVMIAIKKISKINLRNTQKLAIMMFLKNEGNLLAQISTGEGKSLIIVCIAIVKAIAGQKVDIITSSHVLAERDAKEYSKIYKLFGLSVGHNSCDNLEERKKVYSSCQIVYGELSNFQQDYLLDRIYDKNVLGDRSFETILVDEVDSLLLDRGNNTLYLSHEIPGLDKLEPVFVYIWKWFNTPTGDDILNLKEDILIALGCINKNCLKELDNNLSEMDFDEIWEVLVSEGIISKNGIMMKDEIGADKLNEKTKNYINHIKYLWTKVNESEKPFVIPNYLKCFVLRHLDKWIESAQTAMSMENGRHYVVDVDRTGTSADRSPNITILDEDTGTDLANSQWENGLHQFLQLKHGCKQFAINLKAVFISNVSFIKKYKSVYGLSGTLGTPMERKLLIDLYNVGYVTIPTAKPKLFFEMPPITCTNEYDWAREIFNSVESIAINRSVLIICESVNDAMFLKDQFNKLMETKSASCYFKIHTYTRDYEKLVIAENLEKGQIIISTNLAGRGTDIKLSKNLVEAGGLHVCLSFLPRNSRVEEQAFGRVSRKGEPGSAQIIFMSAYEYSISKIVELKKQRDLEEINRITNINRIYEKRIKQEEKYFEQFQEKYSELKKITKHSENVKSQLLQICLDKWAYWLEENLDDKDKNSLSIDGLITDISKVFEPDFSCIKDPFQLTKLAFTYMQQKDFKISKELFDKVIEEEHYFSEVALYYRIVAKHSLDTEISELLEDFSAVKKLLNERISSSLLSGFFIDWLKSHDMNSIIQMDSFKNQQKQRSYIYNIFLDSINTITGHEILPHDLLPSVEKNLNNMFIATRVYSKCVENNIIQKPQLRNFQEKDLTFALQYGVDPKQMGEFLRKYKDIIGNVHMANNSLNTSPDENVSNFWKELVHFFPSRELFWSELLSKKQLVNEVNYLFLDMNRLTEEMPFLKIIINNLGKDKPTFKKNFILLYENDKILKKVDDLLILKKNLLKSTLGTEIYRFIKKHGVIHGNKAAEIGPCWNKSVKFKHFDSLQEADFGKVGINSEVAKTIIDELVENNIVQKCSSNYYSLITNEEEINKLKLARHQAYTSDVKSLLKNCFAFRIAHQKLVYLVSKSGLDCMDVQLPLQTNLHKLFLCELEDTLLTKPKVNPESDVNLEKLYPRSMKIEHWEEIFCMFFNEIYARYIIQSLKERGWLLHNDKKNTYCVNCIKAEDGSDSNFVLMPTQSLPLDLLHYKQYIEFILLDYLNMIDAVKSIEKGLKEKVGQMYSKETPSFDFKPVQSVLKESYQPTSECHMFSLNGFDKLIIVKEKKYSFKMKISVSLVAALGIAEIAAGAALLTCFPGFGTYVGDFLLSEGTADLIYSMTCLYSGYFSLSDYWKNKMISLTISATLSCGKFATRAFKSVFGKRSAGLSLVKASEAGTASAGNVVVQRILDTSGLAAGYAAVYTTINYAIKQQLPKVGEVIIAIIYGNIDKVIVEHEVIQSVRNIYGQFGKDVTLRIINDCFQRAVDKYKPILNEKNNHLRSVLSVFTVVMRGCVISYNSYYSNAPDVDKSISFPDVLQIFSDFKKLITSHSCWSQIKSLVSEFLNIFNDNLSQLGHDNHWEIQEQNVDYCNYLIFELTEKWKKEIVNLLSTSINENIVTPLSLFTSNLLLDYTCKNISFFSGSETSEMNQYKSKRKWNKKSSNEPMTGKYNFVESEYNRLLFSLLKTERHISALAEISKRNLPPNMDCIETCCQIVPTLLRKEGIEVPPFEVVMEINGVVKRYKTAEDGEDFTTINLKDSETLSSNISNNRSWCVRSVIHILSKSLCPTFSSFLDELANKIISYVENHDIIESVENLDSIESDTLISPVTRKYSRNKPSTHFTEYLTAHNENTKAYQHKDWTFQPAVDVDLREKHISHLQTVEDFILEGFDAALDKINHYISTTLFCVKPSLKLSLQDFCELRYEIWPQCNQSAAIPFRCQAVHYELILPLPVETEDILWDFVITITLNTQPEKRATKSPRGAHICYEVRPLDNAKHQEKLLRGHVLLNSKCQRTIQTVSSCHVAGDLILPTGFKLPPPKKRLRKYMRIHNNSKKYTASKVQN